MLKNRYGNIEDIVKDVTIVTAGDGGPVSQKQIGRQSTGAQLKDIAIGSEGTMGIITSAVVKVRPLPECSEYDSAVFHDFPAGMGFMMDVSKMANKPASVRLVDNQQFRLGQVMKGEKEDKSWGDTAKDLAKKIYLGARGFEYSQMVAVTLRYEGSPSEVRQQRGHVNHLVSKWSGAGGGASTGKAGYELTYAIAYLRDFAARHGLLSESFETFVRYSKLLDMVRRTKERITREHRARGLRGRPLVSCRVTQLYDEGACVYFYYVMDCGGLADPTNVYHEIEEAARDEIMSAGGTLTHHHGVGKAKKGFMDRVNSEAFGKIIRRVKDEVDPDNVFGAGNLGL